MFTEEIAAQSEYETERDKPVPGKHHAFIQSRLLSLIDRRYAQLYTVLAELSLDLFLGSRVPDLSIYPHIDSMGEEEVRVAEMPICAIEILSPTQIAADLLAKRRQYFEAGIKSYWLVLPEPKSVYVFSSPEEFEVFSYRETLKDLTIGIELPLSEVFK
jgi:Uma2 family endonuclease